MKWDRYQALCFQCCRRHVHRERAAGPAELAPPRATPADRRSAVA